MLFSNERTDMRQMYFDAWQKQQELKPLDALEQQIVDVVKDHPEYHYIFNDTEKYLHYDFNSEVDPVNPFMHLSMHLAIRDQVNTNKPIGIRGVFANAATKQGDHLEVEHRFMEVLINELYSMQNAQNTFDEQRYLENLTKIVQ